MSEKDHDNVQSILTSLGLDTTTAIKIFFKQVEQANGLPFSVTLDNPEITPEMANDIRVSDEEYEKGDYKSFDNVEDLLRDLKN